MDRPQTSYAHFERRSVSTLWRPKTGLDAQDSSSNIGAVQTSSQERGPPHGLFRRNTLRATDILGGTRTQGTTTPDQNHGLPHLEVTANHVVRAASASAGDRVESHTRPRRPSLYEASSAEIKSLGRSTARKVGKLSSLFVPRVKDTDANEAEKTQDTHRQSQPGGWLRRARSTTFRLGRRSDYNDDSFARYLQQDEKTSDLPSLKEGSVEPIEFRGGAAARAAAAAASRARSDSAQAPLSREISRLKDMDLSADSESGIGIDLKDSSEADFRSVSDVSRKDPAQLPPELFEEVLSYLDAASVLNAELVSKRWLETATSYRVWRHIFGSAFKRRSSLSRETPMYVGGYGVGKTMKKQDWKQMWKVRKALDDRWKKGRAAAIYLEGHTDSVYCVQFDEDKIITGSRDRTIRVWDTRTYRCVKVLGVPKSGANNSMTSPIGQRMKDQKPFASVNPTREWLDEQATPRLMNHHGSILCLQFDSNIMVTGSSDNTLIIWDLTSDYQPIHRLEQHTAGVLDVCFDSKHIVSCSKDTTICLWDRKTGSLIRTFSGHRGPVNAVQLRGNLIVSASGDAFAKLWDIESGNCIKEFASKDRGLACVDFSPDSKTILVGGNDQVIYQFDANTGELVRELTGHSGLVRSLHLDSVNRRVISGSYDYSVKAFDASNGDLLCDFVGWTTSWMLSAKADYRRIVATSQDGRVVIMDFGYALKGIELLES